MMGREEREHCCCSAGPPAGLEGVGGAAQGTQVAKGTPIHCFLVPACRLPSVF